MTETAKAVGSCKAAVVKVDPPLHLILFIVNIIFPGWGTMISACVGKKFEATTLIFGLLQMFLFWTIIGWIWSIVHGYWIYEKSAKK